MANAIGEADGVEGLFRECSATPPAVFGIDEGQLDIFERGEPRHQLEGLKNEPDSLVADLCEGGRAHGGD